jgi:hypothetical protein
VSASLSRSACRIGIGARTYLRVELTRCLRRTRQAGYRAYTRCRSRRGVGTLNRRQISAGSFFAAQRKEAHMLLLGVTLITLALLFMLSSMALATAGKLSHPRAVTALLVTLLLVGLLVLSE